MAERPELPILAFDSRDAWDRWLSQHHLSSAGIWLKFFKKHANVATVVYSEALDVALCHGWIDSQVKRFDEEAYLQRFGPRGPKSVWSEINRRHVSRLIASGEMKPAGLEKVEAAQRDGRWEAAYASPSAAVMPEDFRIALDNNPVAKAFYGTLNKANTYGIITRIHFARKAETRQKRIKEFVEMLARREKLH